MCRGVQDKATAAPCEYRLRGVVVHAGMSRHSGHYIAYCRNRGDWYEFNDEIVGAVQSPPLTVRGDESLTAAPAPPHAQKTRVPAAVVGNKQAYMVRWGSCSIRLVVTAL